MIMMSEWTLSLAALAARKDVGANDLLVGKVPAALGENLIFVVEVGNIARMFCWTAMDTVLGSGNGCCQRRAIKAEVMQDSVLSPRPVPMSEMTGVPQRSNLPIMSA